MTRCWCCSPGSVSTRQRVCASLYLLENPRGMRSRTSLVCLGDAGVYSVLVAYTQLGDTGVWCGVNLCAFKLHGVWLRHLSPVSLCAML